MTKHFRFRKRADVAYSSVVSQLIDHMHTYMPDDTAPTPPEYVLLALLDRQPANWQRFVSLLSDDIRIASESVSDWIAENPQQMTGKIAERRYLAWREQVTAASYQRHLPHRTHSGHLIVALLHLDDSYLVEQLTAHEVDVAALIEDFYRVMQPDPNDDTLAKDFYAFLNDHQMTIQLSDDTDATDVTLTVPAVTLMQHLVSAFQSTPLDEDFRLWWQWNTGELIDMRVVSDDADDDTNSHTSA